MFEKEYYLCFRVLRLQSLYGAHELRILNPLIFPKHLFLENLLGREKRLLSDFRIQDLLFLECLQQFISIFII
jgi:hypothetical protein